MKAEIEEIVRHALTEHFTNDETTAAEIIDEATDQLDKMFIIKNNVLKQELITANGLLKSKTDYCIEMQAKVDFLTQELSLLNS